MLVALLSVLAVAEAIRVPPAWSDAERVLTIDDLLQVYRKPGRPAAPSFVSGSRKTNKRFSLRQPDVRYLPRGPNRFDVTPADTRRLYRPQQISAQEVEPVATTTEGWVPIVGHAPVYDHEVPREVPTKPIYPGVGQWAIPGSKHQPYVESHMFRPPSQDGERPDGIEVFERVAPIFDRQLSKFRATLTSPSDESAITTNKNSPKIDDNDTAKTDYNTSNRDDEDTSKDDDEVQDDDEDQDDDDFVPTRTLAQVRQTEDIHHLPRDPEEGRLREVIKDSKIHTVYTEEGYEDVAYDHAGEEKNAEEAEGQQRSHKKSAKTRKPKAEVNVLKEFEDYQDPDKKNTEDAEASGSTYKEPPRSKRKHARIKENKVTEYRDSDNGEMEITSEVKILTQPHGKRTAHKFVKIVPKQKKAKKRSPKKPLLRKKRQVNDIPKIDVQKDFLDELDEASPTTPPPPATEKYPYYKLKGNMLNKSSPLRYAEDLNNIPAKTQGEMSFYKHSKVSECPEIPKNVDPVPDRIKQGKPDGEYAEQPHVPRLRNLGDKIDCLKIKLFGENPLDSPIFQEETVGAPEDIFGELRSMGNAIRVSKDFHKKNEDKENPKPNQRQAKGFTIVPAPDLSQEKPQLNEIERMDTNDTAPEASPLRRFTRRRFRPRPPSLNGVARFGTTPLPLIPYAMSTVLPKYKTISEVYYKDEIKPNEQLNVFADVINNIKNNSPQDSAEEGSENVDILEQIQDNLKGSGSSLYNVYLTSTRSTTPLPRRRRKNKYKRKPEVAQESIQNVYNRNPEVAQESIQNIQVQKLPEHGLFSQNFQEYSFSNQKHKDYGFFNHKPQDHFLSQTYLDHSQLHQKDVLGQKDHRIFNHKPYNHFLSQSSPDHSPQKDLISQNLAADVLGLSPPLSEFSSYNLPGLLDGSLNTFTVSGLKPPPSKRGYYSTLRQHNRVKRKNAHRIPHTHKIERRSAVKPSYSEIRRSKGSEEDVKAKEDVKEEVKVEEEDDYVPNRNRSFYYDVNTRKVVYVNKKEEEDEEPEPEPESVVEEDDDEEYLTLRPPTSTTPKFVVITTERNGPSFLDYVQQLKNNSDYKYIVNPKDKKEDKEPKDMREVESSSVRVEGPIPDFLSVILKLKSDDSYKYIKEPEEKKKEKKEKSTTPPPVEEEEEEETTTATPVFDHIFDINEFIPKRKDYTNIDYSRYKTIQRAPTRHALSSKYSEDEMTTKTQIKAESRQMETRQNYPSQEAEEAKEAEENRRRYLSSQETEKNSQEEKAASEEAVPRRRGGRRRNFTSGETKSDEETIETRTVGPSSQEETSTPRLKRVRARGRFRPTTTTAAPTTKKRVRSRGTTTTTTTESNLEESDSQVQRVVRRRVISRQPQKVPPNHKEVYTPIKERPIRPIRRSSRVVDVPLNNTIKVEVFKPYDPNQKHGGNLQMNNTLPTKSEAINSVVPPEDSVASSVNYVASSNGPESSSVPSAYEIEDVQLGRLADIVPKPFAFYSDPGLAKSVNELTEEAKLLFEEETTTAESAEKDYEDYENQDIMINFKVEPEVTKKPVYFIKDPSKRLYYYAPVK